MTENTMIMNTALILHEKGKEALDLARQIMEKDGADFKPLQEALAFFMNYWQDILHPALLSLSCEAVGGNSSSTTQLSAALVLLAGAADVHDDILDQSLTKGSELTVYGKYGKDIALLSGDILILKGMDTLFEASEEVPKNKRREILKNIRKAFFEVSKAEAEEASSRGKTELSGEEYLETISHKVAAGEAAARIGAIMGDASESEIEILGHYAKKLGILMRIRDEVIDMYEPGELENRFKQGCLPLPILLAFQNEKTRIAIRQSLEKKLTEDTIDEILDLVLNSKEYNALKVRMKELIDQEKQEIVVLKNPKTLELILTSIMDGI